MKHHRKVLLALLLALLLVSMVFLPLEDIFFQVMAWSEKNPGTAVFAVGGLAVLVILSLLPVSPVLLLAGFLFGVSKGLMVIWLAGLIASTLAFLIGRTVARPWVERRIGNSSTFIAIDRAIARKGLLIVLLTRLVMVIPYPALNYSLGLTRVRLRHYLLGTNLGMIPPMFLFVYLGTTVNDVTAILTGDVSLQGNDLLIGASALAVVITVVVWIIRSSLKVLKEELAEVATSESSES